MLYDQSVDPSKFSRTESEIARESHRLKPELG